LPASDRDRLASEAGDWLTTAAGVERGDSAAYSVISQKGDVLFVHARETPEELNQAELDLRGLGLFDYLTPAYSYFSVIEVSLYEVQAMAMRKLTNKGLEKGTPEFEEAYAVEFEVHKKRMDARLFGDVPPHRYICFYPMNKRRGEHVNWYSLPLSERRAMMRNHGSIGHKYHEIVKQVVAGSVGLDDWEWGVSLHSDDAIHFKKLIYEMRFDPASALFAEFGPFYLGIRINPDGLTALLEGQLKLSK
jgi:peroxiredoxin